VQLDQQAMTEQKAKLAHKDHKVLPEIKEPLEQLDLKEMQDQQDHKELLEIKVKLVQLDHKDKKVK
jgi:hypothetical protein